MRRRVRMRHTGHLLDRIVILLLALAGLAERAAGAPRPIRCLVLWPLRQAEAVAGAFLAGFPGPAPHCVTDRAGAGDGFDPGDALSLALSLRMLALALQAIAEEIHLSAGHPVQRSCLADWSVCWPSQRLAVGAWLSTGRLDTS